MTLPQLPSSINFQFDVDNVRVEVNTYFNNPDAVSPGIYMEVYCYRTDMKQALPGGYQITKITPISRFDPHKVMWWGRRVKKQIEARNGPSWEFVQGVLQDYLNSTSARSCL